MQYLHVDTIAWLADKFKSRIVHLEQFGFRNVPNMSKENQSGYFSGKRRLRKKLKGIPGVRKAIYTFRDFQAKRRISNTPPRDAGVYHLFAILQKIVSD
jgi:hypothetical protein